MKTTLSAALAAAVLLSTTAADAALVSRLGGKAYYDDVLNITWLTDANYVVTSGYAASNVGPQNGNVTIDGRIEFNTAQSWANSLDIDGVTGWRLPTFKAIQGYPFRSFDSYFTNDGSSVEGTSFKGSTTPGLGWITNSGEISSELGYLYYDNLGNIGACIPNGAGSKESCIPPDGFGPPNLGLINTGPFKNIVAFPPYWSSSFGDGQVAWFSFSSGYQQHPATPGFLSSAWPVHDGDVRLPGEPYGQAYDWSSGSPRPVPLPAAAFLLGPALGGLGFMRRRAS